MHVTSQKDYRNLQQKRLLSYKLLRMLVIDAIGVSCLGAAKQVRGIYNEPGSILVHILQSRGIHEKMLARKLKCFFCYCDIDYNNIDAVFDVNNESVVSCLKLDCRHKARIYMKEIEKIR